MDDGFTPDRGGEVSPDVVSCFLLSALAAAWDNIGMRSEDEHVGQSTSMPIMSTGASISCPHSRHTNVTKSDREGGWAAPEDSAPWFVAATPPFLVPGASARSRDGIGVWVPQTGHSPSVPTFCEDAASMLPQWEQLKTIWPSSFTGGIADGWNGGGEG